MFTHLPPLNGFRVFEAAARLNSFKLAAAELNVTPTAVSHQIRGLESTLGIRLFLREPRSVTLTDEGRKLAASVQTALGVLAGAVAGVTGRASALTVSTTTSFAALWLVPRLPAFRERHPDLEVKVQTGETPDRMEWQTNADLAIRYGPQHGPQRDAADGKPLGEIESFAAYWNPKNLRKRPGRSSLLSRVDLLETRWQNPQLPAIGWEQWLARYAPRTREVRVRSFDTELHALQAAMTGDGIVLASDLLASLAVKHGWLRPYRKESVLPGLSYRVVTSPDRRQLPKVQVFCRWVEEEMGSSLSAS